MRTRNALKAAPWLAGTALVVFGATVSLSVLGQDLLENGCPGGEKDVSCGPLTPTDVQQRLAHNPEMMAGPGRHHPDGPVTEPGGAAPAFRSYLGNTVYASCYLGQARLATITAQQYKVIGKVYGPARTAYVRFSHGTPATTVTVTVTCVQGQPHFSSELGLADTAAATGAGEGTGAGGASGESGGGTTATKPAGTAPTPAPADDGGAGGHKGGGGGKGGGGAAGGSTGSIGGGRGHDG